MAKTESSSLTESREDTPESTAIGLDVGATKIEAALITVGGQVLAKLQIKTQPDLGAQSVLDRMAALINELASTLNRNLQFQSVPPLGIGIGIPGQIYPEDGIVREAVNLGWDEVHLIEEIRARIDTQLPIWIETDANASTMGEFYFGAAQGIGDFVFISIGSGLGGGIFIDGKLLVGANGKAAELGHLSLDPDGLECVCGLHGCVETIVSGSGLSRLVTEYLLSNKYVTNLRNITDMNAPTIVSEAQLGDELAIAALSVMGHQLGIIIANCASILDPVLIVIGGGLGIAAFDMIIPPARYEIERRVLPSIHSNLKILPSQQISSALGAASLVFRHTPGAL